MMNNYMDWRLINELGKFVKLQIKFINKQGYEMVMEYARCSKVKKASLIEKYDMPLFRKIS